MSLRVRARPDGAGATSTDSYSGGAVCAKSGSWICGSQDAVFATYVTSAPPQIGVSPSSTSFADEIVGSTSGPQTVTISNTASSGSQSLAIGQLTVGGANPGDFALGNDTCSNASVPPGSDCTVDVSFTPGAVGSRSASLSIPSNAAGSPDQVPLSGTGTTQADVALIISGPGSAKRGTQVSFTITVSNAGPSTAHDVVMSYPVPSGAKFAGVTTTQGTCTHPSSGGTVRCSLGDLAKGGSAGSGVSIKITAKVGSTLASIASAYSTTDGAGPATLDPNTSNNWMSLSTTVT